MATQSNGALEWDAQLYREHQLLIAAINLATQIHAGQLDLGGEQYIYHPLRVGIATLPDITAALAGILHDAIEDGPPDTYLIIAQIMPPEVQALVSLLTRGPGDTYEAYIERISSDPIATKVKLADLADNLRPERLAAARTAKGAFKVDKLIRRYEKAQAVLLNRVL